MNYPKVSIIVPCYNVGKYLDRCINSLVSNYYPDKELIFVNDGRRTLHLKYLNRQRQNTLVSRLFTNTMKVCLLRGIQEWKMQMGNT